MLRRPGLGVLITFLIFILSCAGLKSIFKKPTVKYESMSIAGISLKETDLEFNFKIINPNSIGISFTNYDYHFEVNNNPLLQGTQQLNTKIPANGGNTFKVPAKVNYSDLFKAAKSLAGRSESPYRLRGTASVKTPIGPIEIPFSHSGKFPLFKKPDIKLTSLKMSNLSLIGATLLFDIQVNNPNILELNIVKFNHNFAISGNEIVKSQTSEPMKIQKKGQSQLSIPVNIRFADLGSAVQDVLKGRTVNYRLNGNMDLKLPGGPLVIPYDQAGTIDIQK